MWLEPLCVEVVSDCSHISCRSRSGASQATYFFIVRAFRSSLVQDRQEQCDDVHHIPSGEGRR